MSTAERPQNVEGPGAGRSPSTIAALAVALLLLLFAAVSTGIPYVIVPRRAPSPADEALRKLQERREADRKILSSYDLSRTPVRIPIERAMTLLADEASQSARDGAPNP
ncbi:MAG: hypothetical protein ABI353_00120 [Isosphaeraceae bacterium]